MNEARTSRWATLALVLACSGEASDASSTPIAAVDACALLSAETVAETLEVDEAVTSGPSHGTFVGDYLATCGYSWRGGSHRLAFTVERDEGNRYLTRFRTHGLPMTAPVDGLGTAAFVRADGALTWGYDDQRIYVLHGELGSPMSPVPRDALVVLARTVSRP